MEDDKIRLLILGDSGVGKTCLLHLLCNGTIPKKSPAWTIGCNFDVLIHNYKNKSYFIEFCDVGGSIRYANARSVFYKDVDGNQVVIISVSCGRTLRLVRALSSLTLDSCYWCCLSICAHIRRSYSRSRPLKY
jgi:GTPase SAR1 family protein